MMKAEVGKYILSEKTLVEMNKQKFRFPPTPVITIDSVESDKVSYVVSNEFVEGNSPVADKISSGEKKEYSYSMEGTATIYDEEYDYTIENEMVIECR